jgi:phage recombination protein Bet
MESLAQIADKLTPHIARKPTLSQDQVALIKRTIAKGVTDDELALFLQQCNRTGLDPFSRQIYCVKRKEFDKDAGAYVDKAVTQVSIDGFRLVAQRSDEYQGQTPPQWCADDGVWMDVWLKHSPPAAARVGVWRKDFREPAWGVARFAAYAQTKKGGELTSMWARMPDVMIAKCAEALALRKAFPQELSGLYTTDEMSQAEVETIRQEPPPLIVEAAKNEPEPPAGAVYIRRIDQQSRKTKNGGVFEWADVTFHNGEIAIAKGAQLVGLLEQIAQDHEPVVVTVEPNKKGFAEITEAVRWKPEEPPKSEQPELEAAPF